MDFLLFDRRIGTMIVSKRLLTFMAIVLAMALAPARASVTTLTVDTPGSQATGTADLGGTFVVSGQEVGAAGTGNIQPFLRLGTNTDFERGYNTSAGFPLDDKSPINFTHAINLGSVPIVTLNGVQYREFLLDTNQVNNGNISLNQVQIFQSAADVGASGFTLQEANATHNATISFPNVSNTEVFRMSASLLSGTANQVVINSGNGSGTVDMSLLVLNSLFTQNTNSFVTLFSQFGTPPGVNVANDGFEEWKTNLSTANPTPEPSTMALAGLGALGFIAYGLRRRLKK